MILYRTKQRGLIVEHDGACYGAGDTDWDDLINREDLSNYLQMQIDVGDTMSIPSEDEILAPLQSQEVWAAGVTYYRSRTARMEESEDAGGADFYDRVYHADRPELFLKATPHRVVGAGQSMHLRRDSTWIVPEPELTLVLNRSGDIVGYTIGNDLSCRDIEGQNPLYLPQAKTFSRCAAVGPGVLIQQEPIDPDTAISIEILRNGDSVFTGDTQVSQMKKTLPDLAEYLFRDNEFPVGCLLMTGTGIVPQDEFSLQAGDTVNISIEGIGRLSNTMV